MTTYDLGDKITLSTVVRNSAGTAVNTPTVTIAVTKPDGTAVSPAPNVSNTGAGGIYTADIAAATVNQAGLWRYVWTAAGTVEGTDDGQFDVAAARAYVCSLEELKGHLRQATDREDERLRDVLAAVTDIMEPRVGYVTPRAVTEWHTLRLAQTTIVIRNPPLVSVTSLTADQSATAVDASTYRADTELGLIRLRSRLCGEYQLVIQSGHNPWPAALKEAGKMICQHEWTVRNGTGGRPSPDMEQLAVLPGTGFLVPIRALELMRGACPWLLAGIA